MKGIICENIDSFKLSEDLPEPEMLAGHAIVNIRRIGICGTDYHAFKGNQPFVQYPRVLGHELSGVIERMDENAEGLAIGDKVSIIPYLHCGKCIACRRGKTNCCTDIQVLGVHLDGGMRERISVPVTHLIRAEGLSLDEAAIVEPLAIGAHAVRRAQLSASDTVMVIGAGPIGLGVMLFAKNEGASVIAMDLNEERLAFCKSWAKVDHTLNALDTDATQQLLNMTDGELPVAVFDATGNAASMTKAFDLVAHGGKLIFVGLVKGDITFSDPEFHKRELTLVGSRNATASDFRQVMDLMTNSRPDIGRYITHRSSFEGMIDSFGAWLNPASKVIKAIVEL